MPRIHPVDPADSEGSNREVFESLLKERGTIPNMMRTVGHRPEHLRTMVSHMRAVMRSGTVPAYLKELLAIRVSRINTCEYALASHTSLARRLGVTGKQIEVLLDISGLGEAEVAGFPEDCLGTAPTVPPPGAGSPSDAPFTLSERSALLYAERMTVGTGRVDDAAFLPLLEHFDPGQIVEITLVVGLLNGITRLCNALEIEITP